MHCRVYHDKCRVHCQTEIRSNRNRCSRLWNHINPRTNIKNTYIYTHQCLSYSENTHSLIRSGLLFVTHLLYIKIPSVTQQIDTYHIPYYIQKQQIQSNSTSIRGRNCWVLSISYSKRRPVTSIQPYIHQITRGQCRRMDR